MAEIELGLYHYRFIYQLSKIFSKDLELNTLISHIFEKINLEINPTYALIIKKDRDKLKTHLKYGNLEKITDITWESDDIIRYISNVLIPLKIDSIITEKNIKITKLILPGIGYKINSVIAFPIHYEKELLFIFTFYHENKTFSEHEFEMLKKIFNILNDHIKLLKLQEMSEEKCKYFSMILDNLSSGIIIYSEKEIKYVNKKAYDIFEINKKEEIPSPILDILEETLDLKSSKTRQEIILKIKNKEKTIGYSATYIKNDMGSIAIMILQDITNIVKKT
ncbi:MAG: PAS domain-containing protein [Elusimicrobiales bacterium]|nr:PAS domain-containing protein [Elusimicrobiales bacterium]